MGPVTFNWRSVAVPLTLLLAAGTSCSGAGTPDGTTSVAVGTGATDANGVVTGGRSSSGNTTSSGSGGGTTTPTTLSVANGETSLTDVTQGGTGSTTYPRGIRLRNGTVLVSFTRFQGSGQTLVVAKSTDNGSSFQDLSTIATSTATSAIDNAVLLELPSSASAKPTLLAAFRNHEYSNSSKTTIIDYRITLCRSTDGGASWSFLVHAVDNNSSSGPGLWEPFLRVRKDGTSLQLIYSLDKSATDQDIAQKTSTDGGASWSAATSIVGANLTTRVGMPGATAAKDGNQSVAVMVFENQQDNRFVVQYSVSYDDGASWSAPAAVYTPPSGHNAGAPQVVAFGDGSLAAVFMTDANASSVHWTDNAQIQVAYSAAGVVNGDIRWQAPQVASAASSYWPGILPLSSSVALALYDHGGAFARRLELR